MDLKTERHTPLDPCYLHDGVYASHDGWQIWLTAHVDGRPHEIALDEQALEQLETYRRRLAERLAERRAYARAVAR